MEKTEGGKTSRGGKGKNACVTSRGMDHVWSREAALEGKVLRLRPDLQMTLVLTLGMILHLTLEMTLGLILEMTLGLTLEMILHLTLEMVLDLTLEMTISCYPHALGGAPLPSFVFPLHDCSVPFLFLPVLFALFCSFSLPMILSYEFQAFFA